ncbi:MAG: hypothetical protein JOZ69_02085 [Myxococcales bacterium]|nr:hypothetical protein [Myxococcales bacterium]
MIAAVPALARPPVNRLLFRARTWLGVAAWSGLSLALAVVARSGGGVHPTDRALLEVYSPLALPLLAYVLAGAAAGSGSLSAGVLPLVSFGASPARATTATVAVGVVAAATAAALLAGLLVLLAHGQADPPLGADLVASVYAGALGGAAYGALFLFGATLGRRGGGRALLLAMDWVLGAGGGFTATLTPRGHVRNLFGGAPPLHLPERASALLLLLLTAACGLLAVARASRRALG